MLSCIYFIDILQELKESDRYNVTIYESYLQKAKSIDVTDLKRYPFTSKSQSILYFDLSLAIFTSKDKNDRRILRLNELLTKS